jgi:GNAT superfamily N-acetyltransferase
MDTCLPVSRLVIPVQRARRRLGLLAQRVNTLLQAEGMAGIGRRIMGRLKRRPLRVRGHVVALRLDRPLYAPPPGVAVEVDEIKITDEDALEALAAINEWQLSKTDLSQCLAGGRRCYVARHAGRIVSSLWYLDGEFDSLFLGRSLRLADDEILAYNLFTAPAFRGKGFLPYLQVESALAVAASNPHKRRILAMINVTNKASLRAAAKAGFTRVGQVGFVELFGIRLHYILGRDALPATRRRFFFERM